MGLLRYLLASIVGQNPMAILYTYMGSTLRSMEDVMSDQTSQVTGYLILSGQVEFLLLLHCLCFYLYIKMVSHITRQEPSYSYRYLELKQIEESYFQVL